MSQCLCILFAFLYLWCFACSQPAPPGIIVDLTGDTVDITTKIAVQICSGLYNRNNASNENGVYTVLNEPYDSEWLKDLYGVQQPVFTDISAFLSQCIATTATGYIRYNYTQQQHIVPNLISLAAVLDAVLLQDDSPLVNQALLVFDAIETFRFFSVLQVTEYMYEHYVNDTSTLSFMDPNPCDPGLIDYIVKERLFNLYLIDACIRDTPEYAFFQFMTNPDNNPWQNPINVMGYNDAWRIAGDLFEAETDCTALHNLGQVASAGFNNFAFFSRTQPISTPLKQTASEFIPLNRSKIYIAFTIGDGDNLSYLKAARRDWMADRVSKCEASNYSYDGCFPLQWSISPHTAYLAPDMLQWYYNQSYRTGRDWFVLPPSGHLYAYPSEMDFDAAQANFIRATERDCRLLSCNSSVVWEFVFTWNKAISSYFPRYAHGNESGEQILYGLYAVNVPYNVPVEEFWIPTPEFFKVLDDNVVLFKPREWRGANYTTCMQAPLSEENCFSPQEMAFEINHYPKSTVTHIYVTSDGGGDLQMIYDLVPQLKEYVEIVSPTQLINLALQKK